ncbi:MAG TPA: SdiA-regulated domain-containing protein [Chitinophagaceae bacterium]|nr:SdiA-regulated domain-containing protein [Chitinophagaceae bacterium]
MNKLLLYLTIFFVLSCNNSETKESNGEKKSAVDTAIAQTNHADYDLSKPEKFLMPDALNEVSGIAFYKGNKETLYGEQDEDGKLYYLHPGDKKATHVKFGKKGDYEDLAIVNDRVVILRSDGTLFSFPFNEVNQEEITNVKEWKDLLPAGEFEGLYGDEADNKLYVLCKQCDNDKTSEAVSAYILQLQPDGNIIRSGNASINVKAIDDLAGKKKIKFNPSALAKNPKTQQWYIISSTNNMLVIADNTWNVKEVHRLDPSLFRQPEGIAFDSENNLYISNEGDVISRGNVLKFAYKPNQ